MVRRKFAIVTGTSSPSMSPNFSPGLIQSLAVILRGLVIKIKTNLDYSGAH